MNSLKENYLYNILNQLITFFIPLLLVPYTSRTLGASNIGIYSYTFSIATVFSSIGRLGVNTYGQLQVSQNRDDVKKRSRIIWELMSLRVIFTVVEILLYLICILAMGEYLQVGFIMILYLISDAVDISWIYQGFENFKSIALRNFVVKILNFILIFLFIHGAEDLYKYTFIMQATVVISNLLLWSGLKKYAFKPCFCVNKNLLHHIKHCLIYFIPTIANIIYNMLDKVMLGYIGKSSTESGYYEQAYKIVSTVQSIILAVGLTTLPRLTYLYKSNRKQEFKNIISKALSLVCMLLLPMSVGLFLTADIIVRVFLGQNFEGSIRILQILSILLFFASLNYNLGNQILVSTENQKQYNVGVWAGAVVNFLLNLLLIKQLYAAGAAIGSLMAEVIIFLMFIYSANKIISLKSIFANILWKYFIASAIMGVFTCAIRNYLPDFSLLIRLILIIVLAVAVYFSTLAIIKEQNVCAVLNKLLQKNRH